MFKSMSSPGLSLIWVDRPWAFVASSCDTTLGRCSSRPRSGVRTCGRGDQGSRGHNP
jgi:hypothetical protein